MLATYASALLVLAAAAAVGQAVFRLCGRERWSWLAPATGLAVLLAVAWWSVRLPGEGTTAAIVLGVLALASAAFLRGRVAGLGDALRAGALVAALALLAASLPFLVEGRFGILGTGLNPDMSQHLFAADRLAESGSERLIASGYPLGPHALAVSLSALGPGLVQAFGGITMATAVIGALTPLGLLRGVVQWRRIAVALLVGFAYMTASYLTQGAFKETMQALFLLAFAIGLGGLARGRVGVGLTAAVPLAVLAVGSAYAYSFPGLVWLLGAAGAWGLVELARGGARRHVARASHWPSAPSARPPLPAGPSSSPSHPSWAAWPTSRSSRRSTPTVPGSATCSTGSRHWRRSGSGRRATSASNRARASLPPWRSGWAPRSASARWRSASGGG